jgi:hypothetical protein
MATVGGYVSQEVYDKVDALAKKMGISKSQLVGQAVTTSKIISPPKKDSYKLQKLQILQALQRDIHGLTVNGNQIAMHCNIDKQVDLAILEKLRILDEIKRLLEDVKQNF